MSLRQLGNKINITAQSLKEIENREKLGTISLKVLRQVGEALQMKLVYGFIPKNYTLAKMIEERAKELAQEIVQRTSITMSLENQRTSDKNIQKAVREKTEEIKSAAPKYLWD